MVLDCSHLGTIDLDNTCLERRNHLPGAFDVQRAGKVGRGKGACMRKEGGKEFFCHHPVNEEVWEVVKSFCFGNGKPGVESQSYIFFLVAALLRYGSHTIQSLYEAYNSIVFSIFTVIEP